MKNYPTWEAVLKSDEPMARLLVQAVAILSTQDYFSKHTPEGVYEHVKRQTIEVMMECYRKKDKGK